MSPDYSNMRGTNTAAHNTSVFDNIGKNMDIPNRIKILQKIHPRSIKSINIEASLNIPHETNAPPKIIYNGIPSIPLYIAILYLNKFNHSP